MIVIVAVDDGGGMMFNGRRQSQDRALREKILELTAGCRLWMDAYSAQQFAGAEGITVDNAFLEKAGQGDCCFLENSSASPYLDKIEQVILFRWNRRYPGDFFFDIDLHDGSWEKSMVVDFRGHSHDTITMEVYECIR